MERDKDKTKSVGITIVDTAMGMHRALNLFNTFRELKEKLLMEEDISKIGGKVYIMKSGWRKIKAFFRLSQEIVASERIEYKRGSAEYVMWRYRVRVTAPDGTFAEAEGVCTSDEPFGKGKPEHAIAAMAQTRAFNRAISDLVGGGEVSAEELEGVELKEEKKELETFDTFDERPWKQEEQGEEWQGEETEIKAERSEERAKWEEEELYEEDRLTLIRRIGSLMKKLGHATLEDRRNYAQRVLGKQVNSVNELTTEEIVNILKALEREAIRKGIKIV